MKIMVTQVLIALVIHFLVTTCTRVTATHFNTHINTQISDAHVSDTLQRQLRLELLRERGSSSSSSSSSSGNSRGSGNAPATTSARARRRKRGNATHSNTRESRRKIVPKVAPMIKLDIKKPTGGETIRYALEELFPSEKVDMYASASDKKEQERLYGPNSAHSVLRKLCDTHMVCNMNGPKYELENVVIFKGQIYLNSGADEKSLSIARSLSNGRLPPHQVFDKIGKGKLGGLHFRPGPHVMTADALARTGLGNTTDGGVCTAANTLDTTAHIHYPFSISNGFHALNDNTVSLVLHILMQHVFDPKPPTKHRSLFLHTGTYRQPGLLFELLLEMFDHDVQSADLLFKDGPFCVKRITWSSPIKIFYKKSLPGLLQLVYRFIQVAVSKSLGAKLLPQRELLTLPSYLPKVITASLKGESFSPLLNVTEVHKLTGKNTNQPKKLKAVIVSRNVAKAKGNSRNLAKQSEESIKAMLEARGIETQICTFSKTTSMTNLKQLWALFADVNICIGVHGAGLGNCILMPPGGLMVELQPLYAFGSDLFMKMAHMSRATYIHFNIKPLFRPQQLILIPSSQLENMIETIMVVLLANHNHDASTSDQFISTSKRLSLVHDVYHKYLPKKKLQGGSRFHIQVDQQFLIFPPPDISGDRKSWVRGPLAHAELRECVSSMYYYFQTQAVKMKNISSDNDICAIVV